MITTIGRFSCDPPPKRPIFGLVYDILAFGIAVIGGLGLIGWLFHSKALTGWNSAPEMSLPSAVCFFLIGICFLLKK